MSSICHVEICTDKRTFTCEGVSKLLTDSISVVSSVSLYNAPSISAEAVGDAAAFPTDF